MPGGIEKAIISTANLFSEKKQNISIIVLGETDQSFYSLQPEIPILNLNLNFGIGKEGNFLTRKLSFIKDIKVLKNKLTQISPDIIITTEYVFTVAAYYAKENRDVKLFSWEHHHFHHLQKSRFWNLLSRKIYPKIDCIVCLNKDEADFFQKAGCKTFVIPNFIVPSGKRSSLQNKQLLTVGWFSKTKGTDLIPEIAEAVFKKFPDWKWKVIGSGNEIQSMLTHPNIEIEKPFSQNIEDEYLNASIYVLPSRFECLPFVLMEAMAAGVPCVAFDCPTGPKHIILTGKDGILVETENTEAMAEAIINLVEDEKKKEQLGSNAFESIKRFSPENSYQLWERLFNGE